jgi:hypothetical protein
MPVKKKVPDVIRLYSKQTLPANVFDLIKGQLAEHCRGKVKYDWAVAGKQNALSRATYVIVSTRQAVTIRGGKKAMKVLGFALITVRANSLHVDAVCSADRKGRAIMERVESRGRFLKKELIELSTPLSAMGFFKKLGYSERDNACSWRSKHERQATRKNRSRLSKCLFPKEESKEEQRSPGTRSRHLSQLRKKA